MVRKEEIAQAVAGCDLDPALVREGKERLFEERWYSTVFPTADPSYYLSRYILMRNVGYAAKGYPERAYAKWLVLNFLWAYLWRHVRTRAGAEAFRLAWDHQKRSFFTLNYAVDTAFKAALRFYREKRGKGAKALDVSTFFQRKGLHVEFKKFWNSSRNSHRSSFKKHWARHIKRLEIEATG